MDCRGNPGPQYYPNIDSYKPRAPAYSLGLSTRSRGGPGGPGPGGPGGPGPGGPGGPGPSGPSPTPGPYYIGNVDRNGRYTSPGWTIESKPVSKVKAIGPGPSYYPTKVYTPSYSLGLKLPPKPAPFGPSPAEYYPQYTTQGGFTIGHMRKEPTAAKPVGPGPLAAVPTDTYKTRPPAYSLGLKGKPSLYGGTIGPGPKYDPSKFTSKAYSFGMRHHPCCPPLITREDREC